MFHTSTSLFFAHTLTLPFPAHLLLLLPSTGAAFHLAIGFGGCLKSLRKGNPFEAPKTEFSSAYEIGPGARPARTHKNLNNIAVQALKQGVDTL